MNSKLEPPEWRILIWKYTDTATLSSNADTVIKLNFSNRKIPEEQNGMDEDEKGRKKNVQKTEGSAFLEIGKFISSAYFSFAVKCSRSQTTFYDCICV
jgi:hypothetical protein